MGGEQKAGRVSRRNPGSCPFGLVVKIYSFRFLSKDSGRAGHMLIPPHQLDAVCWCGAVRCGAVRLKVLPGRYWALSALGGEKKDGYWCKKFNTAISLY